MRKKFLLKIMSVALVFLLTVCTQGNLAIYSSAESDTSLLSAYYTANATQDNPLESESFDRHWNLDANNMAVRKELDGDVWTSNASQKLAVLYVNTKKYKNFQMTVDYKGYSGHQTTDNMVNVVGFGATDMTKSFYFDSNSFAVNINKYGGIMNKQNTAWLSGAASDRISGFSQSAAHTLTLRVYENKATYIIDGVEIYSITLSNYNEAGYIFLATNKMTTQFGIPTVTEIANTSSFSAYYTPNAKTSETVSPVTMSRDWTLNSDNRLQRVDSLGSSWNTSYEYLSLLYVNTKKYKNFEMTVEYKGYSGSQNGDNMINLIGFGATDMTKSFYFDSNTFTVNINKYGGIMNKQNTAWLSGAASDRVSGFSLSGAHTLKLRVFEDKATYSIDGAEIYTATLTGYNEAGYIFLAANQVTTQFGVPTVTEIINTSSLSAYYTSNAKTEEAVSSISLSRDWTVNSDNRLQRVDSLGSSWDTAYNNLSLLYVNTKKYKNFEMTVEYKGYDGSGNADNMINLVGFGATDMTNSFYFDSNTFTVNINRFGGIMNRENTSWIDGANSKAAVNLVSGFDKSAAHTLKVKVQDNIVTYTIDGAKIYATGLTNYNEAGYIFLASNQISAQFGVPTVTELEATEPAAELADSPLYKKSALFIGDSISYGALDDICDYSWGGRIGNKYGMNWKNRSVSGSAITTQGQFPIIKNQLVDGDFDYIVIEGGINDAMNSLTLGEISNSFNRNDFDNTTFAGGLEELFSIVKERYSNSKAMFIVTFKVTAAAAQGRVEPYYQLAEDICEKWNVECLNLYSNPVSDTLVANPQENLQTEYLTDSLHPNAAGYELITPVIENFMGELRAVVEGDTNGDYIADTNDLAFITKVLLGSERGRYLCDINKDAEINLLDLIRLKKQFANI